MNTNNKDVIKNNDLSNLDTIGILLQTARKNRNENLNDVAKQLRIRQVYLEAIENDQFEILPGDIYVVGFIKSYAKCNANSKPIVDFPEPIYPNNVTIISIKYY